MADEDEDEGGEEQDERVRPASVPEGAYWDDDDDEWVHAETNAEGDLHGIVHYYRPDGTRCCTTAFVDGTAHGPFTRYHENGEPSRTGTYVDGTLHGTNVFTRSTAKTTERFPDGLGRQIWRCEMDFVDGDMTEGRLFDRDGRRVMEDGSPFPTQRPAGVPASAHFRKPQGHDDYRWVSGGTHQDGDDWHRVGLWQYWTATGVLVREETYEAGELHGVVRCYDDDGTLVEELRFDEGERVFERPAGVPAEAVFDADDELWLEGPRAQGDSRAWTASGTLCRCETFQDGQLVRLREFLSDGSLAQDSTIIDGGVPRRKWFRRTEDEELDSFPNVEQEDAREVEYLFDEHGRMTGFCIQGDAGELERQELYRNAHGDEDQERFASIDDASRAWIAEGERYTSLLNKWLGELYSEEEPSFEEPTFDRDDLERGVIDAVAELNARGDGALAHAKFPLYYDGIGKAFWDRYGLVVDRVLGAGSDIYARVQHPSRAPEVVKITRERVEPVPGLLAFGSSHDKQYLAFAYDDRIEVQHGGERITLRYPTQYQHAAADALDKRLGTGGSLGVTGLRVCPDGRHVIVTSSEGIYLVSDERAQRLYPLDATLDEYVSEHEDGVFELEVQFANADVSPQGDRITCGGLFRRGIMAGLAIYRNVGGKWVLDNTSQADAFFPAQAVFHRSRPHLAFAACLYASLHNTMTNTTFRIDLEGLAPGEIDEFGGGLAQEPGRVQAIASFGNGFLLGFDNGYVRWMGVDDNLELLGYVFVGGSILHIDVAADERGFVVASDSGLVSRFTLGETASPNLISSMPLVDESRMGFFRTFPPLRW